MKKLLAFVLFGVVLSTLSGLTAFGQAISVNGGAIQGTITDTTGAVVGGATVRIENPAISFSRALTTDNAGFYSIGPLVPGNYKVTVSGAGFSTLTVDTVVRTGTATSGNFKLQVGSETTTIEVAAGALQINTEQAGVADVLTQEQIKSIPVNGRNFLDLAQLTPGVIMQSGESFDPTKAGYSAVSLSGVSGRTTRLLLDGQDITDETVGTTIFNVPTGAISEFQMNRSTQDVSGEVTSTGQILVSTNSGTNNYHGQLFYNFQDYRAGFAHGKNALNPPFQRNQFGGAVGGPIIREKLFFFADAERIKQDSSSATPVSATPGSLFSSIAQRYPVIPSPYRETYSTGRLDYNGPRGTHFFVRANYNVNSVTSNYNLGYAIYANRDNTPGIAAGADFISGRFTHSVRGSYMKFHNLITDATTGSSSIYNPFPGLLIRFTAQNLYAGPNYLAPQGTFQTGKQLRYDGSWTKGSHVVQYGVSTNRLLGGGFAAFYGLSPRVTITQSTLVSGDSGDPLNYRPSAVIMGNGQGYFTENAGFGLPGGGVASWRMGAYIQDVWKITPTFTLTVGLRYSRDTDKANQNLGSVPCTDVDPSAYTPGEAPTCTGRFLDQFGAGYGREVDQPNANLGPRVGFVYSPGSHKTSIRGGAGIYYENTVWNNQTNARTTLIKQGYFFAYRSVCGGTNQVTFPGGQVVTSVDGVPISTLCSQPIRQSGSALIKLQQQYKAAALAAGASSNGDYAPLTSAVLGAYSPNYKTPYSIQINFGIQHEIWKGAIISADYVHNATQRIIQQIDVNRVGAARTLNATAARNAIAATNDSYGCGASASIAATNCAIAAGAVIEDYAGNGLDSGNTYLGGYSAGANGYTTATGAAFPGLNPKLGDGNFLVPNGRSAYDAMQIVFRQQKAHPMPFINDSNFQVSYNLSRVETSSNGGSDQFFSANAWDNDNPTLYMGRAALDHKHMVTFGGAASFKYGPRLALSGRFYSAAPSTLQATNLKGETAEIFRSDYTGDGTVYDVAPGTNPGAYMHDVTPGGLNAKIASINASSANKLTPAGQAVVNAGLLTSAQMAQLGAVTPTFRTAPNPTGNPVFGAMDAQFSYPIRLRWLGEQASLEPAVSMYNVLNYANFDRPSGNLLRTTDSATTQNYQNGVINAGTWETNRNQRGSGTFAQTAPRSTEFALRLNF